MVDFVFFSVWIWRITAFKLWSRQVHYIQNSATGMRAHGMFINLSVAMVTFLLSSAILKKVNLILCQHQQAKGCK